MGGRPVQILRVNDGHGVEFNKSELERILLDDSVKDRPVVVISIAGAYRQGKSFLLNFFLWYLKNNGRSNWIDDRETPPRGFQWRSGCRREKVGILIWNEVFLMTDSNGEEVAVLLMDTQGTFDSESTVKESVTIFSLSMMTSSVQIYNVMNNIKEDDLQHLQFFAEYGRLALKENETRPFQKLLFLVRDWNWPVDFEFGSHGGRSLITSLLKITEKQAPELKTLRQSLLSCFSDIDGFLLPYPGEKVVRETSFDGRLKDIKEEFREKLIELVPSVLAPENLLVKQVNGKKLSCQHLMNFFRTYVEVFKGSDLPEPASMFMATANATAVAAMENAKKLYTSSMKNRPRRNLARLHEFHREKRTEAMKAFNDFPKLGGEAMSGTFLDVLTKDLEELFDHFFKEEEELIKKEQEEEAKREREGHEQREREEKMKSEQILEKMKAEAREAEWKREIELLKEQRTMMDEALQRERELLKEQKTTMDERLREKEMDARIEKMKEECNRKIELLEIKLEQAKNANRSNNPNECIIS